MAWAQEDLDRIDRAISSNIRRVKYADGREVEYQSVREMLAARQVIKAEIQMIEQAQSGLVRRRFGAYRSGL